MNTGYTKMDLVRQLCATVKMTRAGNRIADLLLNDESGFVTILYRNGYTKLVSVGADSGIALIQDVLRAI